MKIKASDVVSERIKYLYEETDFLHAIFEKLSGYAIIAADFDGNIIAFNEGARIIYGYPQEEVVGKRGIETFFPADPVRGSSFQETVNLLIDKGTAAFEGEGVRKGGARFPARFLFTLTKDKGGRVVGFIVISEDITERRKMEKEKENQINELEEAIKYQQSLTGWQDGSITATLAGVGPLSERSPEAFSGFQSQYEKLLDTYLDAIGFGDPPPRGDISTLARRIGAHGGGPRDVVEIHIRAVKAKCTDVHPKRAHLYAVEGRLLALEVMGNLVDFYRLPGAGREK